MNTAIKLKLKAPSTTKNIGVGTKYDGNLIWINRRYVVHTKCFIAIKQMKEQYF